MKIQISAPSPLWPAHFALIKRDLELCLQDTPYVSIEHVGSTSVPGLAAKPIIDVDVVVTAEQLDAVREVLVRKGGYESRGEMGIPGREVMRVGVRGKGSENGEEGGEDDGKGNPKRNLYVCLEGGQAVRNHLAVRDLCRRDEGVRDAYAKKKRELAEREWADVNEYTEGKNEVLFWILGKAGFGRDELEEVRRLNVA